MQKGYIIIDVGTGNLRVGIVSTDSTILALKTKDVEYQRDLDFIDAVFFDADQMFNDIRQLIVKALSDCSDIQIKAVLSTSQREGIVLLDEYGQSIVGLPNVDNRGREWEQEYTDSFEYIYQKTGRWPTTVFSALKLKGIKERQPDIWKKIASFTSISDWIGYKFTNQLVYESSQSSETLLFDVGQNEWSEELCELFGINSDWLPKVKQSGTVLGIVKEDICKYFNLDPDIPFIIGGADTQLAVKGAQPELDDIVIVSGTTTPILKVTNDYLVDHKARCWVNRHVNINEFIIETNAGVSGLNYQRLKKVLFPNQSYEAIEQEVLALKDPKAIASFSTLVFDQNLPLVKGGFYMDAPLHHELTAADFVFGILFDIASSIKYNFDVLLDISPIEKEYVLGCGGGFKGKVLPQLLADLLNKRVIVKEGYSQATIIGGVIICNTALGECTKVKQPVKTFNPSNNTSFQLLYKKWYNYRNLVNKNQATQGRDKNYVN